MKNFSITVKVNEKEYSFITFLLCSFLFLYLPIGLFLAIGSVFGLEIIGFNDKVVSGWEGFFTGLVFMTIFPAMFAGMMWIFLSIGSFIFSFFVTLFEKAKSIFLKEKV